jgi:two-component system, LytTR family, response regulator
LPGNEHLIKAVIIDDEPNSCEIIQLLLQEYCPEIQVAGVAYSCQSGINLINNLQPQLVFLDLELQDGNGAAILAAVTKPAFEVIFVTAYEKRFLYAIRFSELELILKPVERIALISSINVIQQKLSGGNSQVNYEILIENLSANNYAYKILLPAENEFKVAALSAIIFFEEKDQTTVFHFANEMIIAKHPFKYYTELFSDLGFFQITNQQMVNLSHIVRVNKIRSEITMDTGIVLKISGRRINELQTYIDKTERYFIDEE